MFVVGPDREVVFAETSRDYADRSAETAAIDALQHLGLGPTARESIQIGPAEPGSRAMPLHAMEPYFRGAKFAVTAMKMRHPEVADDAAGYIELMDRYIELVRKLRGKD